MGLMKLAFAAVFVSSLAWANHPILVEGNCDSPVPGTTLVAPGTCGDFDGDGRISTAEDTDGADRIFGTIGAAIGPGTGAAAGTGANGNGTLTIVTSGRFAEAVVIGSTDGNITLEAASGVSADIDAVRQGDPGGGNTTRQNGVGISVAGGAARRITLRNLTIRNFTTGIQVAGDTHLSIESCRVENNLEAGIDARGASRVHVQDTTVRATGHRVSTLGDAPVGTPPASGAGVVFAETASGTVVSSTVTGNVGAGVRNDTGTAAAVCADGVIAFDNGTNFVGLDALACDGITAPVAACPACPEPVVQARIQTCKKCKTRGDQTTCTKCTVELQ